MYILFPRYKLRINVFAPLSVALLLYINNIRTVILLLSAAALHELAHILFIVIFKCKIKHIDMEFLGMHIVYTTELVPYKQEMIISIAGVFANLITFMISTIIYRSTKNADVLFFALSNITFATVNILPIKGLDGGNALRCLMYICSEDGSKSEKTLKICSNLALAVLTVIISWAVCVSGFNMSLVIIVMLLLMFAKDKKGEHL